MRLGTLLLAALLACAGAGCPKPPPPAQYSYYALGMTYADALAVSGHHAGRVKPPWPTWPPTSLQVPPPSGVQSMRLLFTGACVSSIEATYEGRCEDGIADRLIIRYGPPVGVRRGEHLWTDGIRDVVLATQPDPMPNCGTACADTCTLRYSYARRGLSMGGASTTHGLAACRSMGRRADTRFAPDPWFTTERRLLDILGYLAGAPDVKAP
jgi:hypothetical protein